MDLWLNDKKIKDWTIFFYKNEKDSPVFRTALFLLNSAISKSQKPCSQF